MAKVLVCEFMMDWFTGCCNWVKGSNYKDFIGVC